MPKPADIELILAAQGGDRQAYAELVRRYMRPVLSVALRELHDYHEAEDVAQEAFLDAFATISRLRSRSRFVPWLLKITRRRAICVAKRRRKARLRESENITPSAVNSTVRPNNERLLAAVHRLPEGERTTVNLRYFAGLSVNQIVEATGWRIGTVTKQLSRAHARLRQWLDSQEAQS